MASYSSGWYPTTSSSSPSINLFIPYTSSQSRETHEMYNELGFILRPSKITPPPSTTTDSSKSSFKSLGSSFTLAKSRSYVNEMVRRFLGYPQLSAPVTIEWPYSPSSQCSAQALLHSSQPLRHTYTSSSLECTIQTEHLKNCIIPEPHASKIGTTLIFNYKFSGFRPGLSFHLVFNSMLSQLDNRTVTFISYFFFKNVHSFWLCTLYGCIIFLFDYTSDAHCCNTNKIQHAKFPASLTLALNEAICEP